MILFLSNYFPIFAPAKYEDMQNSNVTTAKLMGLAAMAAVFVSCNRKADAPIDRVALLERNNPVVTAIDTMASLTVGNGDFAMTVDVTGLQTFPEKYSNGVPLGTMSSWGWHRFDNPEKYDPKEVLVAYDFGTGSKEALYSQQVNPKKDARKAAASDWLRANPHRLHLGNLGLFIDEGENPEITDINQKLDLLTGTITSDYKFNGMPMHVVTACAPEADVIGVTIEAEQPMPLVLRIPGPTGKHSDDASDWLNTPDCLLRDKSFIVPYGFTIDIEGGEGCALEQIDNNKVLIEPRKNEAGRYDLTFRWRPDTLQNVPAMMNTADVIAASEAHWKTFWTDGAAVDFSDCTDPRAKEMERRVVLSQYLLAINSAGHTPPQETGLTYNSWFGKFHLEMIYWHQAWLPLWGHGELLDRTLSWYKQPEPHALAKEIAERQGYKGVRWMKMTDPSGMEAPSKVGSFLIWQQPHPIYLAELLRRNDPSVVDRYYDIVMETATFMGDFAVFEPENNRFVLKGNIPAQETLRAAEVVNSPYELSEWRTVLMMAQHWREIKGEERVARWDSIIDLIAPLAWKDGAADNSEFNVDKNKKYGKVYLACETNPDTYSDRRLTSDHMAVLGALGIYPDSRLINDTIMSNTLSWVMDNWNWNHTWGWDYPMTAMCAARLNRPDDAVSILLNKERTNTYLPNGHNFQDQRLRCYLPGNGGLLTAVAMMCAGWDGCELGKNPGWPKDGKWNVRWEGLKPLP